MLQNLRDNLKGAVAVVVIVIFVVPLVLFGVEQLFVGSVGGTDAATVNGEGISKNELQRELNFEKNRLMQQRGLEPNSPQLEDSLLTGPVLDRMVRKEALLQAAKEGGMGASKEELWRQITQMDAFHVDGKFDQALFKERISYWFTPATFLEANAKDLILDQLVGGIRQSAFVTDTELEVMAAISEQKRSFFQLNLPRAEADSVAIDASEVREYYESNSAQFLEPESVVIEYVELSLDELASNVEITEAELKAVYEAEVSEFDAEPKYEVAHILLESEDNREEKIAQIQSRLDAGGVFAELAEEFSDDLGSKGNGGELGVMVEAGYPEEFVEAAKALEVGSVSGPVETDAGVHFIKLLDIQNAEPPTFAERKEVIKSQLAKQKAQEEFVLKSAELDEKTFGADNLKIAAEALGLEVKVSPSFTRRGGTGIAASKQVVDATFAEDVFEQSHNSAVLNLEGDRSVVLRLKSYQPELLKPFDSVKTQIERRLVQQKLDQQLQSQADAVVRQLNEGVEPETIAEQGSYEYTLHSGVTRASFDGDAVVLRKAFSLARPAAPESTVIDRATLPGTGIAIVGLTSVEDGSLQDIDPEQLKNTKRQIVFQANAAELSALQAAILDAADVEKPEPK